MKSLRDEYIRKLVIRTRRWIRREYPDMSKDETKTMSDRMILEGEKMYDEIALIFQD